MKDSPIFFQINTTQNDSTENDMRGGSSLGDLPSKFSKTSSKYVIQPKSSSKRNKSNKGCAVLPYNEIHNQVIDEDIEEERKFNHAETVRAKPNDTIFNELINRSKTMTDRQENNKRNVKVCKCKRCGRLSFIENDVCFYCHRSASSNWKSLVFSSIICCCWCAS
ncbi:unnamed protein product [Blepharisma stoltei]|uniref:Uncharacterized protein n=1 Tax=Blepharisma stoltei TaxID=1481888 RepID=A0AAU9JLS5_9CILI|nr:unnamed protein product [Blepharisma stoltei]